MSTYRFSRGPSNCIKYSYTGFRKLGIIYVQSCGALGMLFFTFFSIFFLIASIVYIPSSSTISWLDDARLTALCFSVVCVLFSWFACGMLINYSPTIWICEEGLIISHFVILKAFIPWSEVTNVIVKERWYCRETLILAKRISLFHKLSSILYFGTPDPCFVIGEEIENHDELISKIRSKALYHSKYYADNLIF